MLRQINSSAFSETISSVSLVTIRIVLPGVSTKLFGSEIPGADEMGLDPDKVYYLYRDPAELEKAAASSNKAPTPTCSSATAPTPACGSANPAASRTPC